MYVNYMYVHVCICMYMYVQYTCICMYTCMYVHTVCTCMYCVHVCMYVCTVCTCMYVRSTYVCTYICMYLHVYVYMYIKHYISCHIFVLDKSVMILMTLFYTTMYVYLFFIYRGIALRRSSMSWEWMTSVKYLRKMKIVPVIILSPQIGI